MKKISTLILTITLGFGAIAQRNEQAFDWSFNLKGGINNVYKLARNTDGNLWVLGSSGTQGLWGQTQIPIVPGFGQFPGSGRFLGKVLPNGNPGSLISFTGTNAASITAETFGCDANGNIYVAGTSNAGSAGAYSFGNNVTVTTDGVFVVKYNSAGAAQWAQVHNMGMVDWTGFSGIAGFQAMANGELYLAVSNPNSYTASAPFIYRFWVLKLDNAGAELWHRESSSSSLLVTSSFRMSLDKWVDANGNATITHFSFNDRKIGLDADTSVCSITASGITHFFVLNSTGAVVWKKGFGGVVNEYSAREAGNIVVNWSSNYNQTNEAPFDNIPNNVLLPTFFTGFVEITSTGVRAASRKFNLATDTTDNIASKGFIIAGNNHIIALANASTTGNTYFAGQTLPAGKVQLFVEYEADFTAKHFVGFGKSSAQDPMMIAYGNKVVMATAYDRAADSVLTINGKTLVACSNEPNFGTIFPVFANAMADVAIARWDRSLQGSTDTTGTDTTTSIERVVQNGYQFTTYPNPSTGYVTIESNVFDVEAIQVYTIAGLLVHQTNSKFVVMPTELPNGMYVMALKNKQGTVAYKRFLLQR